jgi:U11/U12 small nuclear ribonucleoprotein 65 kDa protein
MNAIIGVPRLYTQVLHLMNKMNLPCPFGPVTSTPPLVSSNEPDFTKKIAVHLCSLNCLFIGSLKPQGKIKESSAEDRKRSITAKEVSFSGESFNKKMKLEKKDSNQDHMNIPTLQMDPDYVSSISKSVTIDEKAQSLPLLSRKEIMDHRLPLDQLQQLSFMKTYTKGEPACALYIKNLPKKVSETDLRQIFGNYCNDPMLSEQ